MRNENVTLAMRLFSVINMELPDSIDYQIAQFLLENIQTVDIPSTTSLAEQCNVSKASISRFCKNIGLNDFFELRAQVYHYKRDIHHKFCFSFDGSLAQIRRSFLDDVIAKLAVMRDCMEDQIINNLVKELSSDRHVTAIGRMQAGNTALNMQHNLFVTGKIIQALTKSTSIVNYFRTATTKDTAVVFSVSGDCLEDLFYGTPQFAPQKKPKIYLITTNPNLEKKPYADAIYNCKSGYQLSGGNTSLDIIQQLIALSYYYADKGKRKQS